MRCDVHEPARLRSRLGHGTTDDGHQAHTLGKSLAQWFGDVLRREVLGQCQSDVLTLGRSPYGQSIGECDLDAGMKSLRGKQRKAAAPQRTLDESMEIEIPQEAGIPVLRNGNRRRIARVGGGHLELDESGRSRIKNVRLVVGLDHECERFSSNHVLAATG